MGTLARNRLKALGIGRSSHRRCFLKKSVLKNFLKFTGKHLCQSPFFKKVVGLRPVTLLKKRLWHRCFPMNFTKFSRTLFLQNTFGRLLLNKVKVLTVTVLRISKRSFIDLTPLQVSTDRLQISLLILSELINFYSP